MILRRRPWMGWMVAAVCLMAAVASPADEAAVVQPGRRLWGELEAGERIPFLVEGVEDMELSIRIKRWRGATLRPRLALLAPGGASVAIGAHSRGNRSGSSLRIDRLPLAATGTYTVLVSGDPGTSGGFDLKTSARVRNTKKGTAEIPAPGGVVFVPALLRTGDRVRLKVRRSRRSDVRPVLTRLLAPSGETAVDGTDSGWIDALEGGRHVFELRDGADATGSLRYRLRVKSVKVSRRPEDIREIAAAGEIRGRVLTEATSGDAAASSARPSKHRPRAGEDVLSGRAIVALERGGDRDRLRDVLRRALPDVRFRVAGALGPDGPYLVHARHIEERSHRRRRLRQTLALASRLGDAPGVAWAEPDFRQRPTVTPSDPLFPQQLDMLQLNMPAAWELETGAASVVVAVIDTGITPHPDLDDARLPGFDFVSDATNAMDGNGWDADPFDSALNLHGLHVAGTAVARGDDAFGVAGVAWGCRLLPVRGLGAEGGSTFDLAAAIRWSAGIPVGGAPVNANPADVLNMSFGSSSPSQALADACAEARAAGAVLVAAAGNNASSFEHYPSSFETTISVGSVDANLGLASYSNFGPTVDVVAPGGDLSAGLPGILSTWLDAAGNPTHTQLQGTSMASPHVAGVAALLLSADPTLTPEEIRDVLTATAVDLGDPGWDLVFGAGLVDAAAALSEVMQEPEPLPIARVLPPQLGFSRRTPPRRIVVTNAGGGVLEVLGATATTDDGGTWLSVSGGTGEAPLTFDVAADPSVLANGTWRGSVRIETSEGPIGVPVTLSLGEPPRLGIVRVTATGPGGLVVRTATNEDLGWEYTLPGLPPGSWRVRVDADLDQDLVARRIDEYEGEWPLLRRPESILIDAAALRVDDIDVPLLRRDASFLFDGSGGGHVDGAVSVRVTDAVTGLTITGARVRVDSLGLVADTGLDGRALLHGALSGSQTVSAVADGYESRTRAGSNAQFQGFPLRATGDPRQVRVDVRVRSIPGAARTLQVFCGERASETAVAGTTAELSVTGDATSASLPVTVVALDGSGSPLAIAATAVSSLSGDREVSLDLFGPAAGVGEATTLVILPDGGLSAAAPDVEATVQMRSLSGAWIPVRRVTWTAGAERTLRWPVPHGVAATTPFRLRLVAEDASAGRSESRLFGDARGIAAPAVLRLPQPPATVAPLADGSVSSSAPVLQYAPLSGSDHHEVLVEGLDDGTVHRLEFRGDGGEVTLPVTDDLPLVPGRRYRWSVTSSVTGTSVAGGYADDLVETHATALGRSPPAVFVVE